MITLRAVEHVDMRFPTEFIEGLLQGCIEPDRAPDYKLVYRRKRGRVVRRRVPVQHHDVLGTQEDNIDRKILIEYYIKLAAYYYVNSAYSKAGRALGRALHYVQDGVIPSLGGDYKFLHDDLERLVEKYLENKLNIDVVSAQRLASKALSESIETLSRFINEINMLMKRREKIRHRSRMLKFMNVAGTVLSIVNMFLLPVMVSFYGATSSLASFIITEPLFVSLAVFARTLLKRAGLAKPSPPYGYYVAMR